MIILSKKIEIKIVSYLMKLKIKTELHDRRIAFKIKEKKYSYLLWLDLIFLSLLIVLKKQIL
jgi:hypothetical protein